MTAYITHAKWLVAIRRLVEAIVVTVPLFAVLFLPIALFARHIYLWAAPASTWTPNVAEQLHEEAGLPQPAVLVRARGRLPDPLVGDRAPPPSLVAARRPLADPELTSKRRDAQRRDGPRSRADVHVRRLRLDDVARSDVDIECLRLLRVQRRVSRCFGRHRHRSPTRHDGAALIPNEVAAGHFNAIGNVMLAMTVFWAYIAFVQMMLIWIADLPEEVAWYATRSHGSWGAVCWYLGLGALRGPILRASSPQVEARSEDARRRRRVARHRAFRRHLLADHADAHPEGVRLHWLDLAALVAVVGAAVSFAAWRFAAAPAVPQQDPGLVDSLSFEMT